MQNRFSLPSSGSRGFTLLEILIAVFILGIVLTTIFAAYSGVLTTIRETGDDARAYSMARITLDRMSRDLSALQRFRETFFLRGANVKVNNRDFASLAFWSAAHLSYEDNGRGGQPAVLHYTVRENRDGGFSLWRSDLPQARPSLDQKDAAGVIICEDLQSFRLKFYAENGEELDAWDTAASLDQQKGKPPVMVAIELAVENKKDRDKPHRFTTRVFLPVRK